ncbi:exodeoxyribonuclease III Xth [Kribbella flavida DSM 17836]|uniref:Exodeoxyribonuclease III Xth n=1 Tax=Kribbella flavida (strain DSM 17836 / JCM 10339 / NBRC 14399) TaxID=479435 RepID=D2PL06_KRIFD|nr:exodeoxyribonuclease III [Kribbella flavida]ADB32473.1 exodeoxyribonuclease III Xth [Kribbella flavida DSM 17836]
MLKVATVNVNGVRAAYRRGMAPWLERTDPELLLLQEVRATDEVLRDHLGGDWQLVHAEPVTEGSKGRAGVAVASRRPIKAERTDIGPERFTGCGRWVEADVVLDDGSTLTAVSTYVFTGEFETPPRQEEKYAFLDAITVRLTELRADGRHVLMCGDLNIAHREVDLKAWKANRKKSGFLPEERAWLDRLFEAGWVDLGRRFGGDGPGPYSWWSWRGKAFDNDAGWRIDYQIASPELAAAATGCTVDRAPTYAERWSDHAPVVATYEI